MFGRLSVRAPVRGRNYSSYVKDYVWANAQLVSEEGRSDVAEY
jgi:hypothetical protein